MTINKSDKHYIFTRKKYNKSRIYRTRKDISVKSRKNNRLSSRGKSAAVFRKRSLKGGAISDKEVDDKINALMSEITDVKDLDDSVKDIIKAKIREKVRILMDQTTKFFPHSKNTDIKIIIRDYASKITASAAGGTTGSSTAAGGTTGAPAGLYVPPSQKQAQAAAAAAAAYAATKIFRAERDAAAAAAGGGGAAAAGVIAAPIGAGIQGAIVIVRDPITGQILLAQEGQNCDEIGGQNKRYIDNLPQDSDLRTREALSRDLYERIRTGTTSLDTLIHACAQESIDRARNPYPATIATIAYNAAKNAKNPRISNEICNLVYDAAYTAFTAFTIPVPIHVAAAVYDILIANGIARHSAKEVGDTIMYYFNNGIDIAKNAGIGSGGHNVLIPLPEKTTSITLRNNNGNPKYGSAPRKRRSLIQFGAPKGGSEEPNPLDTAQREFIEEVGHVFPDSRFIYAGDANANGNTYAVYVIDLLPGERAAIEAKIVGRYGMNIGETYDLAFRSVGIFYNTPGMLNAMTQNAILLLLRLGIPL